MPKLINGFSLLLVALVACEGRREAVTTHPVATQAQVGTVDTTNSTTLVALPLQDTVINATQPTSSESGDVPALHKLFEEVRTVTPSLQVIIKSVPVTDSTIIREPSDLKLTFALKHNNKIIYRDTTDDGLAYSYYSMPQTKKLYPIWIPVGHVNGELIVAFNNRPSKELARRFTIANSVVIKIDTLLAFDGPARDIDKDGKLEFAGIQDYGEEWMDKQGRRRASYNPTLYYEVRPTGLVLDSALTESKARAQYGKFWGFSYSNTPIIIAK